MTSGRRGEGPLLPGTSVTVIAILSSAITRASVFSTSAGDSFGSTRQFTVARADCGSAFSACPALTIVATHVVRSCALYGGFAESRATAAGSGFAEATERMSAPVCASSNAAARTSHARVVSLRCTGNWCFERRVRPAARR